MVEVTVRTLRRCGREQKAGNRRIDQLGKRVCRPRPLLRQRLFRLPISTLPMTARNTIDTVVPTTYQCFFIFPNREIFPGWGFENRE